MAMITLTSMLCSMARLLSFIAGCMLFHCEEQTERHILLGRMNMKTLLCAHLFLSFPIKFISSFTYNLTTFGSGSVGHGQKIHASFLHMYTCQHLGTNWLNCKLFFLNYWTFWTHDWDYPFPNRFLYWSWTHTLSLIPSWRNISRYNFRVTF